MSILTKIFNPQFKQLECLSGVQNCFKKYDFAILYLLQSVDIQYIYYHVPPIDRLVRQLVRQPADSNPSVS